MKKTTVWLLSIILTLACVCAVASEADNTMQTIMGNAEEWQRFDAIWADECAPIALAPYYRLHFAYYVTLNVEELAQQQAWMAEACEQYGQMIDDPSSFTWSWVDSNGVFHVDTEWGEIPASSKVEALRNIVTIYGAFHFTESKLLPLAIALNEAELVSGTAKWFVERYPNVLDSQTGDGLRFAEDSTILLRNLMDAAGFEQWPIE